MRKLLIISLAFAIIAPAAFQPLASAGTETTVSQTDRKVLETAARNRRLIALCSCIETNSRNA